MAVLVTGAAGFLGRRLVERLVSIGHDVTAIDRHPMADQFQSTTRVTWIETDIALNGLDTSEIAGIDTVFHLAGATLGSGQDEWRFLNSNEATTVRLLQACASRVRKVVFASSQVVYGDVNHLAVTEEFPLNGSASAYACSKLNSEQWLRFFQAKHGGQYIALRFTGFVEGGGIIDYLIDQALRDAPIQLFSRGRVCRDYLSVETGIDALVGALSYDPSPGVEAFNVGSGQAITTHELATLVCAEVGSRSEIVLSDIPAPSTNLVLDIGRAVQHLSFVSNDLRESVRAYARQRNSSLRGKPGHAHN